MQTPIAFSLREGGYNEAIFTILRPHPKEWN
jgi:hypothetical protein